MRVVSSSSLLFTSLVASSVSLPSLAAPVRARRDSIYERQEMGSPFPAAFESSASTSNLAGLVAPPTTPAFRARDNHVFGGALGDFKHEFEGLINALEVSASPAPVPTRSKKPYPSSLSQLGQSTTLTASGVTSSSTASSSSASASSSIFARGDSFFEGLIGALDVTSSSAASGTSTSASASTSTSILPRGDSFFEGLIGALSAPAPPPSASALPLPSSKTPALPSTSPVPASEGSSALSTSAPSTPTLPPQPTNTPAMLARSLGARNTVDELIDALEVSASSHATPAPTSTSASATASGVSSTSSVQSVLSRNGYSGGMLEGLGHYNIMSMTAASASASASPTPSLDARGGDDILGELIGALGVLGSHAHPESATSSQTTSSPSLPMTSPTLGTRDGVLDGLIGALDISTTTTTKLAGFGITSGASSTRTSATGAPTQTMA